MASDAYKELLELRDRIKQEEKDGTGRASTVLTDRGLKGIVENMPSKLSDFYAIDGVGETFIEKYGKRFIDVLLKYKSVNGIERMSDTVRSTLKELEKKLVGLNKNNKLLHISKMTGKIAVDVTEFTNCNEIVKLIFGGGNKVKLCDQMASDAGIARINTAHYNKLVSLTREINREYREKGQYDLYIGYPFVEGLMIGGDFPIRAPLVLFPVKLIRETQFFKLIIDNTRDVVYNNNLILANYKFSGINRPLPSNVVGDINVATFVSDIVDYYKRQYVEIAVEKKSLTSFEATNVKRNYRPGEFKMKFNMVLGKFSTYSSSMQKEINDIIARGVVNRLTADLLESIGEEDIYADSKLLEARGESKPLNEKEIYYINELNSTQERILEKVNSSRELVIEGPPGTGKSQIITSIIAQAVCKGEKILMVSEKKSALDVVHSRLGKLSEFALLLDDVNNKEIFYSQMQRITEHDPLRKVRVGNLEMSNGEISAYMNALENVSEKLTDTKTFGVPVYELYSECHKLKMENAEEQRLYNAIKAYLPLEYASKTYPELKEILKNFDSDEKLKLLAFYKKFTVRAPFMATIKGNISAYEIEECRQRAERLLIRVDELSDVGLLSKINHKYNINKSIKKWQKCFFDDINPALTKSFYVKRNNIADSLKSYNEYVQARNFYNSLSSDAKAYYEICYTVSEQIDDTVINVNNAVYNYLLSEFLIKFEKYNDVVIHNIRAYDGVIDKISSLIEAKRTITMQTFRALLLENLSLLNNGKRSGEIRRVVESKRKWSVGKFIDKFQYELFNSIKVWLLTPDVVSEVMPLEIGLFDKVIFDEASQMYVEKAIPSIMRGKAVIIAGDSKQLRPSSFGTGRIDYEADEYADNVVESSEIAALEEESLLDVARFKYVPIMLDYHYRSHYEELIAFSNYAFYGGKLNVSPNNTSLKNAPIKVVKVEGGLWEKRSNKKEAAEVVGLLKSFFRVKKKSDTIGVIAFNSAQRDLIMDYIDLESRLDKTFAANIQAEMERKQNGEDIGLFIKNIENVQGDERDYIIFSVAYAPNSEGKVTRQYGWLSQKGGENRLNVAVSRAKKHITLVTSIEPYQLEVDDLKNNGPKYLRKYLEYAYAVHNRDYKRVAGILSGFSGKGADEQHFVDSKPKKELKAELIKKGYKVQENIGIGGYVIDLAIVEKGKYVLGIEFDNTVFSKPDLSSRERDYHCNKYLEQKGWKLYRVWASNWWNNRDKELERVIAKIEQCRV